jgi:hypothetical protein
MRPGSITRVARPTDNLAAIGEMYAGGLGLTVLAQFTDHDGFDGVVLGHPHQPYHLEFTAHRGHRVGKAPSQDHLLVFYLPDKEEWGGGLSSDVVRRISRRSVVQPVLERLREDVRGS